LKGLVALLDGGDEVGDLVVAGGLRRDALAFEVKRLMKRTLRRRSGAL
jgi:hypothetical protein